MSDCLSRKEFVVYVLAVKEICSEFVGNILGLLYITLLYVLLDGMRTVFMDMIVQFKPYASMSEPSASMSEPSASMSDSKPSASMSDSKPSAG